MEIGKSKVENGIKEMDRGFSPILISIFQPAICHSTSCGRRVKKKRRQAPHSKVAASRTTA